MKAAIEIVKEKCAGCFGCLNVCPNMAIDMKLSDEGFYIPKVDYSKCNECGICNETCPVISLPILERFSEPLAFASWSRDEETRITSSSGGLFSELANAVLERGGVVYGVVWNSEFIPVHERTESGETVEKMKGSKYVPSFMGETYQMVMGDLKDGKLVLFSGTPCQVAALNKIVLKKKIDDAKLFTVDVVCHGISSLRVFQKYLSHVARGRKIISLSLRDKNRGWSHFQAKIQFEDGSLYASSHRKDPFFFGYLSNLFLNNICYDCPFSKIPRQGDITLGDFWGISKKLHDERGVSLLLINSKKGKKLVEFLKNVELIQVTLDDVVKGNPRVISGKLNKPKLRINWHEKEFEDIARVLMQERIKKKLIFIACLPYLIIKRLPSFK